MNTYFVKFENDWKKWICIVPKTFQMKITEDDLRILPLDKNIHIVPSLVINYLQVGKKIGQQEKTVSKPWRFIDRVSMFTLTFDPVTPPPKKTVRKWLAKTVFSTGHSRKSATDASTNSLTEPHTNRCIICIISSRTLKSKDRYNHTHWSIFKIPTILTNFGWLTKERPCEFFILIIK